MKFTNFPQFVSSAVLFLCSMIGYSQDKKVTTILYNTKPVEVQIDVKTKSIDYIISEKDDFLDGFKLQVPDYESFLSNSKKDKSPEVVQNVNNTNSKEVESPSQVQSKPVHFENNAFTYVVFSEGFATLSDAAILVLEKVIAELNKSQNGLVLKTLSQAKNDILAINRANAVKTYLKIRGVNTDNIEIIHLIGEMNIHEVSVSLK